MAWDDELEYRKRKGPPDRMSHEAAAGFYAARLPRGYGFAWHVYQDGERWRVVLDLLTPWDAVGIEEEYRWRRRLTAKKWAMNAVRLLAEVVRGWIDEHGSRDPGVHAAIDEAMRIGRHDDEFFRPRDAGPARKKQDWTPRGGPGSRQFPSGF